MEPEVQALVDRLARLETGQVSDILDEAGLPDHAISSAIAPVGPATQFAGVALCVRGRQTVRTERPQPPLPAAALDQAVFPGAVVLIDAGGFVGGACLGGFVAYSLQRASCRALVVDGAIRDLMEIRQLGLPAFARAVTPVNGTRRWAIVDLGQPITMPSQSGGSLPVHPGDLVLGDGDGLVVVPRAVARQIIEDAEELQRRERRIGEELRTGEPRAAVFARNPRFTHVRRASGKD